MHTTSHVRHLLKRKCHGFQGLLRYAGQLQEAPMIQLSAKLDIQLSAKSGPLVHIIADS